MKKVGSALLRLARVHSPVTKTKSGKSRRSLMFVEDNTHPPARTSQNSKQAQFQSALNISDFTHEGLQVKVVLMNPNGEKEDKKTGETNCPRKLPGSLKRSFQTLRNSSRAKKGNL